MDKLAFIILCCSFFACSNDTQPDKNKEQHEFFPVKSFLNDQIHIVDSFRLPTRKYTTVNNKTDSVVITSEEFHLIAREFLEPDINDPSIKKFYKETSFADQSIPSITFNYTALEKDLVIRRLDVILRPDPVSDDQVKSIYLEKLHSNSDSSVLKKLYWKKDKYFQIISSKQSAGGPLVASQVKVSWSAD